MNNKKVLRIEADIPIEAAFRKADSFNALQSYPIPPVTTIRGMLYAAMGRPSLLNQDRKPYTPSKEVINEEREFRKDFRDNTSVGIKIKNKGISKTDLRNRMKVARSDDDGQYKTYVAQEETIINPSYIIYIATGNDRLFSEIKSSIKDPERLLYLGRSDDIVCISDVSECQYIREEVPQNRQILAPVSDGENPFLLPVESDIKSTYSTKPAQSTIVSLVSNLEANKIELDDKNEFFEFLH